MTKKELEEENKKLKDIIRELKKEVKNSEESSNDLESRAFGLGPKNEIVEIAFDLEKNSAVILGSNNNYPRDRAVAEHLLKRDLEYNLRGIKK